MECGCHLQNTDVTVLKLEGSQEVFFGVANPVRAGVYMYRECTSSKSSVRSSGNTTCILYYHLFRQLTNGKQNGLLYSSGRVRSRLALV